MADTQKIKKDFNDLFISGKELLESGVHSCMNDVREQAFASFLEGGIPTKKVEDYKFTDLSETFERDYNVVLRYHKQDVELNDVFKCDVPNLDTFLLLTTNGWYYERNHDLSALPKGVIICSLQEASLKYPDIFEKHYGKHTISDNGVVDLNTAFAQDGVFIYIPKNVVLEKTIQIVNIMRANDDLMSFQRNLIVLGENAQARILSCDHSLSDVHFLANNLTEVAVGENAILDYYQLQSQTLKSSQINSVFINQARSSSVYSNAITLYGGLVRNNHHVKLDGEGAENHTYGMYLTDKCQHVDNFTSIDHASPKCTSFEHFKGVLDDESVAAFTGRITVRPDAQQTAAEQKNNNLLLTNKTKMFVKPQLVIDADDVKCSHGATVGQIDEDALFYLRSRGIGEREAKMMMMFAFTNEIIGKIRIEPIRERIAELVENRLRGEVSSCANCALKCNS
jgi:Fe-S cluster assembly protein SufD